MPRERLIYDVTDSREMMGKAIGGSFLAVVSMIFINYMVFCIQDNLFTLAGIFKAYSQSLVLNEILGYWTISFTPITSLEVIMPQWQDDMYIYLAPAIFGGLLLAMKTRSIRWTLVGGVFFVLWGIILPMTFALIFPMFGLINPTLVDASIVSAFGDVYNSFNSYYLSILSISQYLFLGWCYVGSLEWGLVVTIFAIPFAIIFGIIDKIRK